MKTAYTYVTLRYVHDVVTQEFANVGVVLYAPAERHLEARFTSSYERLNALFLKIDHAHFRNLIRYLANRFTELSVDVREGLDLGPVQGIEEVVRRVLPPDDSSLQWSPPSGGLTEDLPGTLRQVFSRLVERYVQTSEPESRTDEDIGKPFRARLDRKHVAARVREKRIETRDYQYDFHYGWKNDIWHLYEPVSFDLLDPGSIVEKANRWIGRGMALQDSREQFKIHFLLGEPRRPETEKAFKSARHLLEKIPGQREFVSEREIESFADSVATEIASHTSRGQ
jgi:hypothetical protein